MRYFERAPELHQHGRWLCEVNGSTLRSHRASYTLAIALGRGRVVTLRLGSAGEHAEWAARLVHAGATLDEQWVPQSTTLTAASRARRAVAAADGSGGGGGAMAALPGVSTASPWQVSVPSFVLRNDEQSRPCALFAVEARRRNAHGAAEALTCSRLADEFAELHAALGRLRGFGGVPELPARKRRGEAALEPAALREQGAGYEKFLNAVAQLAQPPPAEACAVEAPGDLEQARGLLRAFLTAAPPLAVK